MIHQLFDFIQCSPTASHTVVTVRAMLLQEGFTQLLETDPWQLEPGGKYFTIRGMSSLMAFQVPKRDFRAFSVVAPHGDSPCFKVKESPEMRVDGKYTKLNTEVYGGMQLALWTDRPLSVAGRLAVRTEKGVKSVLCDIRRDLLLIPGVAIHMNRGVNEGVKLDTQKDTLPLLGGSQADLKAMVAQNAGVAPEDILSWDLYLYSRAQGTVFGGEKEFIAAPRLDDLECVFAATKAFLAGENRENVTVLALFDNEEIGSLTRQGADSTFLGDVLERVADAFVESGAEAVYGDVHFVPTGNPDKCVRYYSSRVFRPALFRFGFMPAHPAFYVKKSCYDRFGLYSLDYQIAADFDLLVRFLYKEKIKAKYLPLDCVTMRVGGVSTEGLHSRVVLNRESVRACRKYGIRTNLLLILFKYVYKVFELRW